MKYKTEKQKSVDKSIAKTVWDVVQHGLQVGHCMPHKVLFIGGGFFIVII